MKELTRENLAVGDGHEIHVRSYGNPGGIPALFLHGGPGSGVQESQLGIFDPSRFHVIAFDQRGAGLSRFDDRFHANTTPHLVADIERIRKRFGIERWMVVGGSWGATLALGYATAHADRVGAMVLRAVFLGTRHELERAFLSSLPRFYPQLYADFVGLLPEDDRSRVLDAYWDRILDADPGRFRSRGTTPNGFCRYCRRTCPACRRTCRRGATGPCRAPRSSRRITSATTVSSTRRSSNRFTG